MTVNYSKAKVIYNGNGETTVWPIPFDFLSTEDIEVYVLEADSKQRLLASDYLFDSLGKAVIYPHPEGDTPVLAADKQLMIMRVTPLTQQVVFGVQEYFDPKVLERAYDKVMMIAQEQAEKLERAIIFPVGSVPDRTDASAYLNELQQVKEGAEQANQLAQASVEQAVSAVQSALQASAEAVAAVDNLQAYITEAQTAQEQAAASQLLAETASSAAAQDRQQAQTSATEAASYAMQVQSQSVLIASQAQTVQTAAENVHTAAQTVQENKIQAEAAFLQARAWATKTDGPVADGEYSSKYYAQMAKPALPLLISQWSDHLLENISWLRADTFSWQDGNVYTAAYNELLAEYNHEDSTTETDGDISFKRTPKGYKICAASEHDDVASLYNSAGVAWYYILDTENTRFKLPRSKRPFAGTDGQPGNVTLKNQNEIGTINASGFSSVSLPYTATQDGWIKGYTSSAASECKLTIDGEDVYLHGSWSRDGRDSYYSYGACVPVKAGQVVSGSCITEAWFTPAEKTVDQVTMYLYFYVGNFEQEAIEQTAGITSETLNSKQDKLGDNVDYVVDSYTDTDGNWYRQYKSGWLEQGGVTSSLSETVTLLKPFSGTNYTIQVSVKRGTAPGAAEGNPCGEAVSETQVFVCSGASYYGVFWQAQGQGID